MKKFAISAIICVLGASLCFAQTHEKAPVGDQTQEEKDLELLSSRLIRMKRGMDKFVKEMTAAYQSQDDTMMAPFGGDVRVDIVENDKSFTVTADLPGMDKDKIDIVLEGGRTLKISGTRSADKKETAPGVVKQERMEGKFERVLELPAECRGAGISASYKNGVLEIVIPKKASAKIKTVKVKVR